VDGFQCQVQPISTGFPSLSDPLRYLPQRGIQSHRRSRARNQSPILCGRSGLSSASRIGGPGLQQIPSSRAIAGQTLTPRAHEAAKKLRERRTKVTIRWVPRHAGIGGNERADQAAKQVAARSVSREEELSLAFGLRGGRALVGIRSKSGYRSQKRRGNEMVGNRYGTQDSRGPQDVSCNQGLQARPNGGCCPESNSKPMLPAENRTRGATRQKLRRTRPING
jgi:hypothetical protein